MSMGKMTYFILRLMVPIVSYNLDACTGFPFLKTLVVLFFLRYVQVAQHKAGIALERVFASIGNLLILS